MPELGFRLAQQVGASGVNLALVNTPNISPKENVSLVDVSHQWPENVSIIDANVIEAEIENFIAGRLLQKVATDEVLITNEITMATGDKEPVPLFYKHVSRFYHQSGDGSPIEGIKIVDEQNRDIDGANYKPKISRENANIYAFNLLTDFKNTEFLTQKVQYNKTDITGSYQAYSHAEITNVSPLFEPGNPFADKHSYSVSGPDSVGLYTYTVPVVPNIVPSGVNGLENLVGNSFELAPTIVDNRIDSNYTDTVIPNVYELVAKSNTTYTVQRKSDNLFLQSTGGWGGTPSSHSRAITPNNFIEGIELFVLGDKNLVVDDKAQFSTQAPKYYIQPLQWRSIYIEKPKPSLTPKDEWFLQIQNGSFRKWIGSEEFEYAIPEYKFQLFDPVGFPVMSVTNELSHFHDDHSIRVKRPPIHVFPSGTFEDHRVIFGGQIPPGLIRVKINDDDVPQSQIVDWNGETGLIHTNRHLDYEDKIEVSYKYRELQYVYRGYTNAAGIYHGLNLNPTKFHNWDLAKGKQTAYIFLSPTRKITPFVGTALTSTPLYHNFTGAPNDPIRDFPLGEVTLVPNSTVEDVEILDTRSRGGGLIETISTKDAKKTQPESEFYWDLGFFDGKAFPSNGVLIVTLPRALLDKYDKDFIQNSVNKHLAAGMVALCEFV